ncbi:unnamed protein product [Ixodes pacificus]
MLAGSRTENEASLEGVPFPALHKSLWDNKNALEEVDFQGEMQTAWLLRIPMHGSLTGLPNFHSNNNVDRTSRNETNGFINAMFVIDPEPQEPCGDLRRPLPSLPRAATKSSRSINATQSCSFLRGEPSTNGGPSLAKRTLHLGAPG